MLKSEFNKKSLLQRQINFSYEPSDLDDHLDLKIGGSYLGQSFSTRIRSVATLQHSSASSSADDAKIIYEKIGSLPNLQKLQVRFREGLDIPYQALAKSLNQASRLRQFELNCFEISVTDPKEFSFFIESLKKHPSLEHFKLCFSHGATALDSIVQALAEVKTLQKLVLYVKPQMTGQENLSTSLSRRSAELICCISNLKTLKISGIALREEHVRCMAKLRLQFLTLLNCDLTHECAIQLANMLEKNDTLEKLDLSRNDVGDAGCSAIAKALENNSALQGLYLFHDNSISKKSCQALEHMLEKNFKLQDLWTSIDDEDFRERVHFYLNLNRQGTRDILRNIASTNDEWAEVLSSHQEDLSALFYYISRHPLIFCV